MQKMRYHFEGKGGDHKCTHTSKDGAGTLDVREEGLHCNLCSSTFSHCEDEPHAEPGAEESTSELDTNFTDEEDNTGTILINEAGQTIHSFPAIT